MAKRDIDTVRDRNGVEVAEWSDDAGTPERHRHGGLERVETNENKESRRPYRAVDLMAQFERRGDITSAMAHAGRDFARTFRLAALDPLRAADMARETGCGGGEVSVAVLNAQTVIGAAMKLLGGHGTPVADAAWFVLGCGMTVAEFARRTRFGKGGGLNAHVAKGLVVGALGILEGFDFDEDVR